MAVDKKPLPKITEKVIRGSFGNEVMTNRCGGVLYGTPFVFVRENHGGMGVFLALRSGRFDGDVGLTPCARGREGVGRTKKTQDLGDLRFVCGV